MNGKERVNLFKVIEKMNLVNLTPDIDVKGIWIHVPEFNRPALQLTGFYDQFDNDRIQIIGNVEYAYLKSLSETERYERYMQLLSSNIPCLIFCRNLEPEAEIIELAKKYQIPILKSAESTSSFSAEVIRWLKVQLAPCIVIHGVLVDVYGEGVLITGESGIGKSEAALELIKRGHRLVTDDAVEIRKVSDETLVGSAPGVTKYFIELRGIGIIDVKTLFGVESVKETQEIDMVIKLEDWNKDKEYDRLGLEEEYTEYLGNKVDSAAMKATATDSLSDCVATSVVLIGVLLTLFSDINIDGIAGVVVAVFVILAGFGAAKDTLQPLLGQPPTKEFVQELENIVLQDKHIIGVHDLIVHNYGPGRVYASLHAEVPANMDMMEAHDYIDMAERRVEKHMKCFISIHMDPVVTDDEVINHLRKMTIAVVKSVGEELDIHDFRTVKGPYITNLIFDVLVPYNYHLSDDEIKKQIQKKITEKQSECRAVINIDKSYTG